MIKIKNNPLKIPIILNMVLVFILYFDYYSPSKNYIEEEFVSYYNEVKYLPNLKGGGGKDVRYVLECKNDKKYYLYTFPKIIYKIEKGQKMIIKKTGFLSKIKSLKLKTNKKETDLSLLSNYHVNLFFNLAVLITLANFFFSNKILDIFLCISCAYIYLVTLSYLFYL